MLIDLKLDLLCLSAICRLSQVLCWLVALVKLVLLDCGAELLQLEVVRHLLFLLGLWAMGSSPLQKHGTALGGTYNSNNTRAVGQQLR